MKEINLNSKFQLICLYPIFKLFCLLTYIFCSNRKLQKFKIILGTLIISINSYSQEKKETIVNTKNDTLKYDVNMKTSSHELTDIIVTCYMGGPPRKPLIGSYMFTSKKKLVKYITSKIIYPENAIRNNIEGIVKVSFKVKNGRIGDIKIKRSLGYGCDEEVIRLLKYCEPLKLRRRRNSIVVRFKLPE